MATPGHLAGAVGDRRDDRLRALSGWGRILPTHRTTVFIVARDPPCAMSVLSVPRHRRWRSGSSRAVPDRVGGLAVSFLNLLFTSHSQLRVDGQPRRRPNAYAEDGALLQTARACTRPRAATRPKATLGALYYWSINSIWLFWGTYTASEFRGGGRRKRQLAAMVGTAWFRAASSSWWSSVPAHRRLQLLRRPSLAGTSHPSQGLSVLPDTRTSRLDRGEHGRGHVARAGLGWAGGSRACSINVAMCQRALMTWSFDGLLPRRLAGRPTRHTPRRDRRDALLSIAMAVWLLLGQLLPVLR